MMRSRSVHSRAAVAMLAIAALSGIRCGKSPAGPSELPGVTGSDAASASDDRGSGIGPFGAAAVTGQNRGPHMDLRTTPPAVPGNPYPVISGPAPLTVRFNLCNSSDPDAEDSLNYQFHFGDGNLISEGPDFARSCRVEHTYEREGTYVATVSVTDKHLEDQDDFDSLARDTKKLTIVVEGAADQEEPATCSSVVAGSLDASGPFQLGRVFRDAIPSSCPGKAYPGIFNPGTQHVYREYAFTNSSSSPACITVHFDPDAGADPCAFGAHANAYLGSYDPSNQSAGFLGDVGSSIKDSFSFEVPGGADYLVVVQSTAGAVSCTFEFSLDHDTSCR